MPALHFPKRVSAVSVFRGPSSFLSGMSYPVPSFESLTSPIDIDEDDLDKFEALKTIFFQSLLVWSTAANDTK